MYAAQTVHISTQHTEMCKLNNWSKASRDVNRHTPPASCWLMMPSPQAQMGLPTAPITALWCQHALLAVAAFGTAACVTTAIVTAANAAVAIAVIDDADEANMGCNKTPHCAIQHVWHHASSRRKSVMVKVSMPFREVTRGSDPMKAVQGNRTHPKRVMQLPPTTQGLRPKLLQKVHKCRPVTHCCLWYYCYYGYHW